MAQNTFGIGDLAQLTGLPVRTIRFYCDEGIVDSRRSGGGHRRFDRAAVDRLILIRRLRLLGMSLPAIAQVLHGERALAEAVGAERAAVDTELATLTWRRDLLHAVEQADPTDRAARLGLLAAVSDGRAARDALEGFWRRLVLAPLSGAMFDALIDMSVPRPPKNPTPAQVVAYAELVALVADRSLTPNY